MKAPPAGSRNGHTLSLAAFAVIAVICVLFPTWSQAQQSLRIAAIVNDDVISLYDLEARLSMIITTSRMPDTVEARRRLAGQVLRSLIEEKLKLQEARRLGVQVSREDVNLALNQIAENNNVPPERLDAFLAAQGIHKPTLIEKVEADVAWIKVINRSLRAGLDVSDEAIDRFIARLEEDEGKTENQVSEIFLPVDDAADEDDVRETAQRMVEQVRDGASFSALAQSFTQSASAAVTGDLGWIKEGELDDDLDAALAELEPGETSGPIRSVSGFHILHLTDRRRATGLPDAEPTVDLQQLFFPLPENAEQAEIESQTDLARTMSAVAETCEDMERLGEELGSSLSGGMTDVKVDGLAEPLREKVEALDVNQTSEPVRTAGGVVVLMICSRSGDGVDPETRQRLRNVLMQRQLDEAAWRYLRDIRRAAFVDIRL